MIRVIAADESETTITVDGKLSGNYKANWSVSICATYPRSTSEAARYFGTYCQGCGAEG
jgi:hypothetical protein